MTVVLVLREGDSVAVCVDGVAAGEVIEIDGHVPVTARAAIPAGHKVALVDIAAGTAIRKYGEPIGVAIRAIEAGDHVHIHNLGSDRAGGRQSWAGP